MKIKVTRSLTGLFNMAHFEGDIVEFPEQLGQEIIEAGYGIETPESKEETEIELAIQDIQIEKKKGRPKK